MIQTTPKSTNIILLHNICIVLGVSFFCFFIGGGWHLICNPDDINAYFHSCYSLREIAGAWALLFVFGGGAAAIIGAVGAATLLKISGSKNKS